jgi:uracil-DNA glycosylase family 4
MNIDYKFDELCKKVRFCTRCSRMDDSARVLSRAAGPLESRIMFIGEAPGRLGADASEIPFHGDQAGYNFESLLAFAGLDRSQAFVTNAVLCNPKAETGNNSTPTKTEIANCSSYLMEQIELINPVIVVTLGSVSLDAIKAIEPHLLTIGKDVRTAHTWFGRKLVPLYHPGQRALLHRSMANQRSDYQFVADLFRNLSKDQKRKHAGVTRNDITSIAMRILKLKGAISYFALHKLFFLIECEAQKRFGRRLTNAYFIRQKDGPYCTDLHLTKLRRAIPQLIITGSTSKPMLKLEQKNSELFENYDDVEAIIKDGEVVTYVLEATKGLSDSELKTKVYLSSPMRRILRKEKMQFVNLYNTPIHFEPKPHSNTPTQDGAYETALA